jgi:hypothetical protein
VAKLNPRNVRFGLRLRFSLSNGIFRIFRSNLDGFLGFCGGISVGADSPKASLIGICGSK